MALNSVHEIEQAIGGLEPQQLAELYEWLARRRPAVEDGGPEAPTVFEQGLGVFGSPEDAARLDEVVHIALEERRRPGGSSSVL